MNIKKIHHYNVRVYAEDVDFMSIVYHANYLRYFERARTELLRESNLILSDLMKLDISFAINEITINYLSPAKLDDLLTVSTQISEISACSFVFKQSIQNEQKKLISEASIKVVCVNGLLKPKRLPDVFLKSNE
ncbi:YbgC/FadM family acyl-CoA thioesterase [uncultured Legionella sp.]|uniref:YbgC/FadM family acyl-CoA thioesterase n=1 Tax=uncultured Legionella sp. TaxID=210934 RepID=UPI00262A24C3|nr:YbgC/FadM family acyl-CoA thioesterase [uncultured Legionella sp.]